jgi:glucokinase-like ROK family protein
MGSTRKVLHKKLITVSSDKTAPQCQSEGLSQEKLYNASEAILIDLIRKYGEFSKSDLVKLTNYSRTKITSCINSLVDKNVIVSSDDSEYTGGRRSKKFGLNRNFGLIAGVDIGVTRVDLSIADFSNQLLVRYSEAASVKDGPIRVLGRVCSLLEKMLQENNLKPEKLYGIGIGVPGPVDYSRGTLVSPLSMPGWDRYPIIETVKQWFPNVSVVVDNDVNVMALGELYQGAGKGVDNLIFVKIGTGIAAGIVCGGKIYRGSNGCAGNIGHICVDKNGPLCHCGNKGCLEAVAADPAIAERALHAAQAGGSPTLLNYFKENGDTLRAEDVGSASRDGDTIAIEIIRESGQYIGDVLAGLVNFYNPGKIVIGAGVSNLGNLLLSSIRQSVLRRSIPWATRDLLIVFSEIGPDVGVIGAINLAMDNILTLSSNQVALIGV